MVQGQFKKDFFFFKKSFLAFKIFLHFPKKIQIIYFCLKNQLFLDMFYTIHNTTYGEAFFFILYFFIFNQHFYIIHIHITSLFCTILSSKIKTIFSKKRFCPQNIFYTCFFFPENFFCIFLKKIHILNVLFVYTILIIVKNFFLFFNIFFYT